MATGTRRQVAELLLEAGRLLLEYNESTGAIQRELLATARALTPDPCHVSVAYHGLTVTVAGDVSAAVAAGELRYNMALLSQVRATLERVRRGELGPEAALERLGRVEADTPRHPRWLAALALGTGAACLARLLGADPPAVAVAGVATGLGLLARQELGRRHASLLTLPFVAAFLGAVLGGLAIRLGWTGTPELILIVPALMLVPGPHLINGLQDLIDNHVPMSLARLGLAGGILLASALGVVLGVEMTLADPVPDDSAAQPGRIVLALDVALAGAAACGFAVFFNNALGQLWMATAAGMVGHGLRYLAQEAGCRADAATLLGGLAVGLVAAGMTRSARAPAAVIAFAGAVPMMPGLAMYRALGGFLQLARRAEQTEPAAVARTLGDASEACLVVGALGLGVIAGTRTGLILARRLFPESSTGAGPPAE